MADILTQLQTCLDQLATQFYATLSYLTTYHDHSVAIPPTTIPNATPQLPKIPKNPPPTSSKDGGHQPAAPIPPAAEATGPTPDSPPTFASRQRELARDLIIKEQQIEYLISVLPGIGSSEAEQEARIKQLESELRVVEAERRKKRAELRRLGERVDGIFTAVNRGMYPAGAGSKRQEADG